MRNEDADHYLLKTVFNVNKMIISITTIFIASFILYNSVTKQRWMVWQDNHYAEVKFDIEKYDLNQLKLYKEERIEKFKKVEATCNTLFLIMMEV